ncbi:unnamed protein product [Kuraishia capsulata CBS 1993]|uniref:Arsenical-resistance protein n=1 Tax=Kuraishia capsulata CBS 1993 TaxID=1382522 RepID=W6MMQ7_9ASCO|nr:uncharacterized protein KUCA_T00002223001 [Kuraishia capsulata CBS 1993]CDK26252.1 unnamed protein product [Kuraishia capsulata CBS 1993]
MQTAHSLCSKSFESPFSNPSHVSLCTSAGYKMDYSSIDCTERTQLLSDISENEKSEIVERYGADCIRRCCPRLISDDADNEKSLNKIGLSIMDWLLPVWIIVAIALGLILGNFVPNTHAVLTNVKFVNVSIPIAIGLLVMMYPILCRIRYEELHHIVRQKSFLVNMLQSVVINWVIAPLLMLGLAWAFLPDRRELRDGLIIVGLGRCIAMVNVWVQLSSGDADLCAIIVAVNSILQIVLISPMSLLFVNVISHSDTAHKISYDLGAKSVGVFLGIPFGAALLTRLAIRPIWPSFYDKKLMPTIAPLTLIGLLFTIIILFASQGQEVAQNIVSVVRVAAPLVVYFLVIFLATFFAFMKLGHDYPRTCTQSFTAASNNFELAIAVCASVYGIDSQQALAATVGPLVEVPVLVIFVYFARFIRPRLSWKRLA